MLIPFQNHYPQLGSHVFIAEGAKIVGRVFLADEVSVWFNTVIRADVNRVHIGERTNIQDLCICHEADDFPLWVGKEVTVGHSVTLHGCTVQDGALIGIGAILLNGSEIGEEAMIASHALIPEGMKVPPRVLVRGVPAKVVRDLRPEEITQNRYLAEKYVNLARLYRGIPVPGFQEEKH
jgi:carbonic anhydrase/acetyltransferase-like protein (isoleucine patch superfamily)